MRSIDMLICKIDVSNFPWTYDSNESCYLLTGKVTVTPTDGRKPATFGKGDFVTFPAGMVSKNREKLAYFSTFQSTSH